MRTCTKCSKAKPLSEYHNDSKGRDGKAAACKICRNSLKKPTKAMYRHIRTLDGALNKITSTEEITPDRQFSNIFEKLSAKYGSHYNISISKVGKCVLTTHGNPSHSWLGKNWNVEELVSSAL